MRIKLVSQLNGNEILAEPIFTEEKEVLIPEGTKLKPEYRELILSIGIETVSIEDPYEKMEEPHFIVSEEERKNYVDETRKILEGHIYSGKESLKDLQTLAKNIVFFVSKVESHQVYDYIERSTDLYDHTVMVTLLSIIVAKRLQLSEIQQYEIAVGALLHDIGLRYITVPYLNCSNEERSATELFEYKKHTILGFSALEAENWIPDISKKMVLSHHERMDGSGFPLKQRNREIECRIIQVCDEFDCMITGMECKRCSLTDAFTRLGDRTGHLFDKEIVEQLYAIIARYPVGTEMKRDGVSCQIVTKQTSEATNPVLLQIN